MAKKIDKKIWIYIGIGTFLIVGIISWGLATNWKFIGGKSKKSGGSGPSPPEIPCNFHKCAECSEGKCIKCKCDSDGCYTLDKSTGTCICTEKSKKTGTCCPQGQSIDIKGDCCPNNRMKADNTCCPKPMCQVESKEGQQIKVCCEGDGQQCDSKGCYIQCGTEKCYNGGKCVVEQGKTSYCENKDCAWADLPSPNPSYLSGVNINDFKVCATSNKCNCNEDGKCTINTTGIIKDADPTTYQEPAEDALGNPYTFFYKPSYGKSGLTDDYSLLSGIKASQVEANKKCDADDCNNILNIFGNGKIFNKMNASPTECKMDYTSQNVLDFPDEPQCPFKDQPNRCCKLGKTGGLTGQICPENTVCANKLLSSKDGKQFGVISECVPSGDCVGKDGQICSGNGYCRYNDDSKKGYCDCNPAPKNQKYDGNSYCSATPDYAACEKEYKPYKIVPKGSVLCGDPGMGGSTCKGDEADGISCCGYQWSYCIATWGCFWCGDKDCITCQNCMTDRGCSGSCIGCDQLNLQGIKDPPLKIFLKKIMQDINGNTQNVDVMFNTINKAIKNIALKKSESTLKKLNNLSMEPIMKEIIKNNHSDQLDIQNMLNGYINEYLNTQMQ